MMHGHRWRLHVGWIAVGVAVAAWVWAAALVTLGGFDASVFGIPVTSNNPRRALAAGVFAMVAAVAAFGVRAAVGAAEACLRRVRPLPAAAVLAAGVAAVGVGYATTTAGGADAYGYVSQAHLWQSGRLTVPQPWVADLPWPSPEWSATPLGYRPAPGGAPGEIAPVYPPGLPMLLALAAGLGGASSMYAVVPLFGAVLILASYGIGARLVTPAAGLAAAILVATSPVFLFMLVAPMSDVPAAACWAVAFCLWLAPGRGAAAGAGMAAGGAILIRPGLVYLLPVLALSYLVVPRTRGSGRIPTAVAFMTGAAPGVVATVLVFQQLYGSPFLSGYGTFGDQMVWTHTGRNLQMYLVWFMETQGPVALAGVLALLLSGLWPHDTTRPRVLVGMAGLVWLQYAAYHPYDHWWFLRFLLPTWPLVMTGVAALLASAARRGAVLRVAAAVLVAALAARGVAVARERQAFDLWRSDRRVVAAGQLVAEGTPLRSVFLTMQHSGSLRYYSGRITLRYDNLPADWLDRAVAWFGQRDVRVYALLDAWEVEDFRKRFADQTAVTRLTRPLWRYSALPDVELYDLTGTGDPPARTISHPGPELLRAQGPTPPVRFDLGAKRD